MGAGLWKMALVAGVWGGLASLERKSFLQARLSRPLVAGTVMGLLLGDVTAGVFVGMVLELFHLGAATLGAAMSEHETLAATCATAAAIALARAHGGPSTPAMWSCAILLFIGMGPLGRAVESWLSRLAVKLSEEARAKVERGDPPGAVRLNLAGLLPCFLCFGALTAACTLLGGWLSQPFSDLPPRALRALSWAFPAMACVSGAVAARGSRARKSALFAGVASGAVAVVSTAVLVARF